MILSSNREGSASTYSFLWPGRGEFHLPSPNGDKAAVLAHNIHFMRLWLGLFGFANMGTRGRFVGHRRGEGMPSFYKLPSHFSHVQLCATPQTAAHQAPPSLGFSRQEHWSGLPCPSPVHAKWKVKMKSLSRVGPSETPWTAAYQAPPSIGFSSQEYWSGVPLPSPFYKLASCSWSSWSSDCHCWGPKLLTAETNSRSQIWQHSSRGPNSHLVAG